MLNATAVRFRFPVIRRRGRDNLRRTNLSSTPNRMISHILHTAFETVYEAETCANDRQAEMNGEDISLERTVGLSEAFKKREFNVSICNAIVEKKKIIAVGEL